MFKTFLKWFSVLAGASIAGFAVYGTFLYLTQKDLYRISSGTMAPTLIKGDIIRIDRDAYRGKKPMQGEVVVFRSWQNPHDIYIYRIVAIPGDRVVFPKGKLFVNEQPVQAKLLAKDAAREVYEETMGSRTFQVMYSVNSPSVFETPAQMAEDDYFVAGDDRDHARDSRYEGPIKLEMILGRAIKIEDSLDKTRIGKEL